MSQDCLFNFIGVNTVITDFFVYNIIKMVDEVEIESGSVDAFLEKEMGLTEEKDGKTKLDILFEQVEQASFSVGYYESFKKATGCT